MLLHGLVFPDACPKDCPLREDISRYGQSSLCFRCPVLICQGDDTVVPPEEYRKDWAQEWHAFFREGLRPHLPLKYGLTDKEEYLTKLSLLDELKKVKGPTDREVLDLTDYLCYLYNQLNEQDIEDIAKECQL